MTPLMRKLMEGSGYAAPDIAERAQMLGNAIIDDILELLDHEIFYYSMESVNNKEAAKALQSIAKEISESYIGK